MAVLLSSGLNRIFDASTVTLPCTWSTRPERFTGRQAGRGKGERVIDWWLSRIFPLTNHAPKGYTALGGIVSR